MSEKNIKYGLKLYTKNVKFLPAVQKLHRDGMLDYLELLAVPGSFKFTAKQWKSLNIPSILHVPHHKYDFNLSKRSHFSANQRMFNETVLFADLLNAKHIVIHPGFAGKDSEVLRQLRFFNDKRIAVENMPFIGINGKRVNGSSLDNISSYMVQGQVGFCLDIPHLFNSAYANDNEPFVLLRRALKMRPRIIHLSDGNLKNSTDEHLSFGRGNLPLHKILQTILAVRRTYFITLETPKKLLPGLKDYVRDRKYIEGCR